MQDVKINKEIRDYKEKIVLGIFDLRQAICMGAGIVLAVIMYNILPMPMSTWKLVLCAIPVAPCAMIGFFHYNKMPGEELLLNIIRYYTRPKRFPSVPENSIYDDKVQKYLEDHRKACLADPKPVQEAKKAPKGKTNQKASSKSKRSRRERK